MVQMGLTVVLLVAAGLVVRSFVNLRRLDLGFVPSNVLTMTVLPRNPKPSANPWIHQLLERVEALPDVKAAGAVFLRPLALGPIGQETYFGVEALDTTTYAAVIGLVLAVVAVASYLPARRAADTDPLALLR